MQCINISDNDIKDEGCIAILKNLKNMTKLDTLNFNSKMLELKYKDVGMTKLSSDCLEENLKHARYLISLNLGSTKVINNIR